MMIEKIDKEKNIMIIHSFCNPNLEASMRRTSLKGALH
jgi:hypothetical protein